MDFRANIKEQLASFSLYYSGDVLAPVLAVKGMPGAAEQAGGPPFSGADGLALDKAFGSLGWGFGSQDTRVWLGLLLGAGTSPGKCQQQPALTASQLRLICEIVDPLAIVALDEEARAALVECFSSPETGMLADFCAGAEINVMGRLLVSVDGFEDALADEKLKQRAWAQLKRCRILQTQSL